MGCSNFTEYLKICFLSTKHLQGIQTPEPHWVDDAKIHSSIQIARHKFRATSRNNHDIKITFHNMGIRVFMVQNNIEFPPKLWVSPFLIFI